MNRRTFRVALASTAILLPFAFCDRSGPGAAAIASVALPYTYSPVPTSESGSQPVTLSPQRITLPGGLSGWRVRLPDGGAIPTPAVGHGRVLVSGGFSSSQVYAFNAISGNLAWKLDTDDNGPTSVTIDNGVGVYNTESCSVEAVNIDSGTKLWSRTLGDPLLSQPAVANRRVYMVSPSVSGGSGYNLYCMSLSDGHTLWTQALPADVISAPVVRGKSVYFSTVDGGLGRTDAVNGIVYWRKSKTATSAP